MFKKCKIFKKASLPNLVHVDECKKFLDPHKIVEQIKIREKLISKMFGGFTSSTLRKEVKDLRDFIVENHSKHVGSIGNFRDADCCLLCINSERIDINTSFLKCTKFGMTCEDTTTCDFFKMKD